MPFAASSVTSSRSGIHPWAVTIALLLIPSCAAPEAVIQPHSGRPFRDDFARGPELFSHDRIRVLDRTQLLAEVSELINSWIVVLTIHEVPSVHTWKAAQNTLSQRDDDRLREYALSIYPAFRVLLLSERVRTLNKGQFVNTHLDLLLALRRWEPIAEARRAEGARIKAQAEQQRLAMEREQQLARERETSRQRQLERMNAEAARAEEERIKAQHLRQQARAAIQPLRGLGGQPWGTPMQKLPKLRPLDDTLGGRTLFVALNPPAADSTTNIGRHTPTEVVYAITNDKLSGCIVEFSGANVEQDIIDTLNTHLGVSNDNLNVWIWPHESHGILRVSIESNPQAKSVAVYFLIGS